MSARVRRRGYAEDGFRPRCGPSVSAMLWLTIGIILLVIAIAGGAIVHPILFVLGILALVMFLGGWRGRATV